MKITTGLICFGSGIIGSMVCMIMLVVMTKRWKKQRKNLLYNIEKEE